MKEIKRLIVCAGVLSCILLSACCISHDWREATCTEPKTCAKCGKTEGEPQGHIWTAATCTAPRTCSVCGATEGEPLGHDWKAATCTEPKTCTVCGETTGKPLGHTWVAATYERPKTCSVCGATEGEPLKVKYFDMSAAEFVARFNEKNSLNDQLMTFKKEGIRVNLYLFGEQMNMFLQFFDTTEFSAQYGSGLEREHFNKLKLYIATDDRQLDEKYFASFSTWLMFLSDTLGVDFDSQDFVEHFVNKGSDQYPEFVYTKNGIRYSLRFYDDSMAYGEPTTVYAASIELMQ